MWSCFHPEAASRKDTAKQRSCMWGGWELAGPGQYPGYPEEALALEGEQTGVFPSKVEGSQLSVIISAVATALALPHHLVSGQRSIPDVCTVAKGCAGLSPLIPSREAFCISLSSETFATHLALVNIHL